MTSPTPLRLPLTDSELATIDSLDLSRTEAVRRAMEHIGKHGVPIEARRPKRDQAVTARIDSETFAAATRAAEKARVPLREAIIWTIINVPLTDTNE